MKYVFHDSYFGDEITKINTCSNFERLFLYINCLDINCFACIFILYQKDISISPYIILPLYNTIFRHKFLLILHFIVIFLLIEYFYFYCFLNSSFSPYVCSSSTNTFTVILLLYLLLSPIFLLVFLPLIKNNNLRGSFLLIFKIIFI